MKKMKASFVWLLGRVGIHFIIRGGQNDRLQNLGAGVPSRENEDDFLAWELCSDTTPQEYDIPFTVYEDGSATLQLNENVTLSFEKSSFDFDDFQ